MSFIPWAYPTSGGQLGEGEVQQRGEKEEKEEGREKKGTWKDEGGEGVMEEQQVNGRKGRWIRYICGYEMSYIA